MATKTLTLRPVSITSLDSSKITLYPSGTTLSDAHVLINEEVADDSATYIECNLDGGSFNAHFALAKLEDMTQILGISVKARHGCFGGVANDTFTYKLYVGEDSYLLYTMKDGVADFSDVSCDITDDMLNKISAALNGSGSCDFYIEAYNSSSGKTAPTVRVTQMYIEILYVSNPVLQYFKQNGEWIEIGEFNVYYKLNNKWIALNELSIDRYADKNYMIGVIE